MAAPATDGTPVAPAPPPLRLAVVGAGPIGLELALGALRRGAAVEVFERGPGPAAHVEAYHFVRLFSQWSLNTTQDGLEALKELGVPAPDASAFPTGREFVDGYLQPLFGVLQAHPRCKLHLNTEVLSIGRGALLKHESIGGGDMCMPKNVPLCPQLRRETPFRLLAVSRQEAQAEAEAEEYFGDFDAVADCGGFYRAEGACWAGMGGVPAKGERLLRARGRLWTTIPDVLGKDRARFAGRRTLVLGAGMSAATVLRDLLRLRDEEPAAQVSTTLFVTRGAGLPYQVIADDVLPQRRALCELGNKAASGEVPGVDYVGGAAVVAISQSDGGRLQVTLALPGTSTPRVEEVDEFVSCVGYRPDASVYEELQVHQCYASNGPMKLAATLLGGSGDCLKQVCAGVDTLRNPEPGFFILGSKSYGRSSAFLLKIGHEQIRSVLDALLPPAAADTVTA